MNERENLSTRFETHKAVICYSYLDNKINIYIESNTIYYLKKISGLHFHAPHNQALYFYMITNRLFMCYLPLKIIKPIVEIDFFFKMLLYQIFIMLV